MEQSRITEMTYRLAEMEKYRADGEKLLSDLDRHIREGLSANIKTSSESKTRLRLEILGSVILIRIELKPALPKIDARLVAYIGFIREVCT
jgi:hypothetical protein